MDGAESRESDVSSVLPNSAEKKSHRPADRRARWAVALLYLIMSSTIGGWAARVPEIRSQTGVGDSLWGLANTVASIGNVVGLSLIIFLVGRVRTKVLAVIGAALVLVNAPVVAASSNLSGIVAGLVVWALVAHVMDIPMGAMALAVERRYRRPIMGSFDATFGAGALAGGGIGTLCAALGVPPWLQFCITSSLLGSALAGMAGWLPDEAANPGRRERPRLRNRFRGPMRRIAILAFLSGYIAESVVLWGAIYVTDQMGGSAVLGAATYTAAATAGTLALLHVDRAAVQVGRIRLFQVSTAVAAAGFGLCLVIASPLAAMLGFVVLAVGTACVNPSIYTFAGNQEGLSAGEGVSVVEVGQMPGAAVAAPALIGLLSAVVGLRLALGTVVLAALLLAVLVGRVTYIDTTR